MGQKDLNILSLTSIRGIAALWVVLYHSSAMLFNIVPEASFFSPIVHTGDFAVPLFFILSGYVLGLRYLENLKPTDIKSLSNFLWLRFWRIYPVHIFTLLISLVIFTRNGWPGDEGHSFAMFLANCFMVQSWSYNFQLSWNYPSWSISSEWFAYIIFPLVTGVIFKAGRISVLLFAIATYLLSAWIYAIEGTVPFKGIAVVVPTFLGGVALSRLFPPAEAGSRQAFWPDCFFLAAVALPYVIDRGMLQSIIYITIFFALVSLLGFYGNHCHRIWRHRILVYLGDISYSIYMTHAITLTLIARLIPLKDVETHSLTSRMVLVFGLFFLIVAGAIGMYHLVEHPSRGLSRKLAFAFFPKSQPRRE